MEKRGIPGLGETWRVIEGAYKGAGNGIWRVAMVYWLDGGAYQLKCGDTMVTVGHQRSRKPSPQYIPVLLRGKAAWISLHDWQSIDMTKV